MTKTEFKLLIFTSSKGMFDDFSQQKAEELINSLDDRYLDALALNLNIDELKILKSGFYSLKELVLYTDFTIRESCKQMAKISSIRKFEGGRFEELAILENFFYKRAIKDLPLWFKKGK